MKKLVSIVLALMLALSVAAVASAETTGSVYYLNFKPEADQAWQDLAKLYTEQTGVEVKVLTAASGTYDTTLTSEMDKGDNAPTLFQCGNQGAVNTWGSYCLDLTGTKVFDELTTEDFNMKGADGETLYQYAEKLGLTSKTNIDLPGEIKSIVGSQTSLYDPSRAITGRDQDTWLPVQVKTQIKKHLKKIGEKYGYEYSDERLDKCCKALMDMALTTDQGSQGTGWTQAIRPILMEELGMSMEMVWKAEVVTDLFGYLNDIKWGGSYTIMTAIGQSITMTTPIAMARYIVAIANGGYVCDVQLIDSIIDADGNVVNKFDEPVVVNDLSEEVAPYIDAIKEGMAGVVDEGGTAGDYFSSWTGVDGKPDKNQLCGKTGTAETSDLDVENNSWFVCFYPKDEPEIAVVVYVPYGYSGSRSAAAARTVLEYYLSSRVEDEAAILPAPNALAQ